MGAMQGADSADGVAASLAGWLAAVTFVDRSTDEVTALLVDTVADWGTAQGWRVYRRAPSVLSLPPPYAHLRSCVDVGCARPDGPPVTVEVDHTDRRRSVEKLLAEADAGRVAIWLRWGAGRVQPPPAPVRMVTCEVTARRGLVERGRLYSRLAAAERPAPRHSGAVAGPDEQLRL